MTFTLGTVQRFGGIYRFHLQGLQRKLEFTDYFRWFLAYVSFRP
jgi:hypothetical protein